MKVKVNKIALVNVLLYGGLSAFALIFGPQFLPMSETLTMSDLIAINGVIVVLVNVMMLNQE